MCLFKQVRCHDVTFVGVKGGSLERESCGVGVRTYSRARDTASSGKFLPHKCEDLNSGPQNPCKERRNKLSMIAYL